MSSKTLLATAFLAFSSPAYAELDTCLEGLWQVDLEDFAHVYGEQMQANSVSATGDVRMRIYPNGIASISIVDLKLDIAIEDMPPMNITINGGTDYDFTDMGDNTLAIHTNTFDLIAVADILGTPMTIPISSDEGLFGSGFAEYGCSAETLSFETGEPMKIPRHWFRMECTARSCPDS